MMRMRFCTIVLSFFLSLFCLSRSEAALALSQDVGEGSVLPQSKRLESERLFFRAYDQFIRRRYDASSSDLEKALRANTYLVDYYLLKSMILRRTGRYEEAKKAIGYYLEVRPRDDSSRRFFSQLQSEQNFLKRFFSFSTKITTGDVVERPVASLFSFGVTHQPGVVGLGKTRSFSDGIIVCDSLGNSVLIFDASGSLLRRIHADHPVASLPIGTDSFLVLCKDGAMIHISKDRTESRSKITGAFSDAVLLDNRRMLVANIDSRRIEEIDIERALILSAWAPKDTNVPFEPVSLSLYGHWLAVGDRNNGSISVVDISTGNRTLASLNYSKVRDLCWSSWGELFALSEDGLLSKISFAPLERALIQSDFRFEVRDGWALAEVKNSMLCFDVRMFRAWEVEYGSIADFSGFLSVYDPQLSQENESTLFSMNATASFPMTGPHTDNPVIGHAVWGERVFPAKANESPPIVMEGLPPFFLREGSAENVSYPKKTAVKNGAAVCSYLEKVWSPGRSRFDTLILDSSIRFTAEDSERLAGLCLMNAISVFVYALSAPEPQMIRLSTITGGRILYSLPVKAPEKTFNAPRPMTIKIPIPEDMTTSGYPGRSLLSVFLDLGAYHSRDWLPLWGNRIPER